MKNHRLTDEQLAEKIEAANQRSWALLRVNEDCMKGKIDKHEYETIAADIHRRHYLGKPQVYGMKHRSAAKFATTMLWAFLIALMIFSILRAYSQGLMIWDW